MPGTEIAIRDVDWFKFNRVTADLYIAESVYWATAVLFWAAHPTANESDKRLKEAFDSIKHHRANADQTREIEREERERQIDIQFADLFNVTEYQPETFIEAAAIDIRDLFNRLEREGFLIKCRGDEIEIRSADDCGPYVYVNRDPRNADGVKWEYEVN